MNVHSARGKKQIQNFDYSCVKIFYCFQANFFIEGICETLNKMWKKLDLEQFFEKYGQNLTHQKTTKKVESHSKGFRFSPKEKLIKPELELNSELKKCRYCQNEIPIKDYKNHINETCEKYPYIRDLTINEKKIQISTIVKKLNKPLPLIIGLLRKVGLNVSSEQEYVGKLFADSLWLLFNPETKKAPSFEIESEEISETSIENQNRNNTKESEGIESFKNNSEEHTESDSIKSKKNYDICPHCKVKINAYKYDLHITEKCPKRNNQQTIINPKSVQEDNLVFNKLEIEKVHWKLLPQGEWIFTELQIHFRRLSLTKKWKNKSFDEERLLKIEKNLKPNKCFIGKDEFDGYVVYCFEWSQNVILECPIYGNAIYINQKR